MGSTPLPFCLQAFFYHLASLGLSRDVISVLHTADTHRAPEQMSGHIYHLTVCQDDYWIKITIWHFSFSVLAQWTEGKLLQLSMPLSRILITFLRPKTSQACQGKIILLFFSYLERKHTNSLSFLRRWWCCSCSQIFDEPVFFWSLKWILLIWIV